LICGRVKGAIVIPQVPDYPESKLEVISSKSIRDVLSLEVGDLVTVEIYYYDKGKNGLSKKDVSREETQLH
jgi:CTP-dependent riboflavin kinase